MNSSSIDFINKEEHKKKTMDLEGPANFETAISYTGFGKFNILVVLVSVIGMCCNMLDTSALSFILPSAECDLRLSSSNKGILNAITYAGMVCSSGMWGFLSDSFGRWKILVNGYILNGVICVLSSFSQSYEVLLVLRFLVGFVGFGPFAVLATYVAEVHAAPYRASAVMFLGIAFGAMNLLIPALAWSIIPQAWSWDIFGGYIKYNSWNVFLAICSVPNFIAGILLLFFHESPKFLMAQGRNKEAMEIFQKMHAMNTGGKTGTYPVINLVEEKEQQSEKFKSRTVKCSLEMGWKQLLPLFKAPYLTTALLMLAIEFLAMMSLNTVRLWLPSIYSTLEDFDKLKITHNITIQSSSLCDMLTYPLNNLTDLTDSTGNKSMDVHTQESVCVVNLIKDSMYINSMISGAAVFVANILSGYIIKVIGKKNILIFSCLIGGLSSLGLQWTQTTESVLVAFTIFNAVMIIPLLAIKCLIVDHFPTSLRAMTVSLSYMSGKLASIVGNSIFPILLNLNCVVSFYLVSGITLACGALSLFISGKGNALQ